MDVSVVILAFNEEQSIAQLIHAVRASQVLPHRVVEIIVYDDCSTDRTRSVVDALSEDDHRIRLLRASSRQGTMVGMAALARAASADIVVRLDADTMPDATAIARLADAIARGASVAVGANEPVIARRTLAALSAAFAARVIELLKATRHTESYAVGRLVAYRTAELQRLAFPAYIINEDHYSAISIVRGGGQIVYEPAARCKFRVPLTFADYWNQSRRILEGIRQLERIGINRPPAHVVLGAVAAAARARPLDALCWALIYAASSMQPPPERCQPWSISQTTKGILT